MKTYILLFLLIAGLDANGQTFVNYKLTNFVSGGPGMIQCTTNVTLASNTVVTVVNFQYHGVTNAIIGVQYPGDSVTMFFPVTSVLNYPVLGPCTVTVTVQAPAGSNPATYVIVEYNVVNTALPAQQAMVLPASYTGTMTLQSSTNLTTWTTATNGTYSLTNQNRFFRMNLSLN